MEKAKRDRTITGLNKWHEFRLKRDKAIQRYVKAKVDVVVS